MVKWSFILINRIQLKRKVHGKGGVIEEKELVTQVPILNTRYSIHIQAQALIINSAIAPSMYHILQAIAFIGRRRPLSMGSVARRPYIYRQVHQSVCYYQVAIKWFVLKLISQSITYRRRLN